MKIASKLIAIMITLVVSSTVFAGGRYGNYNHRGYQERQGNYVGAVAPRGNVYYRHHREGCYGGGCAAVVLGSIVLGTAIANQYNYQPPIQVYQQDIYVQENQPQIIYAPQIRCEGELIINNVYYCPVLPR